jgi:outer membrane receptor protein involved in Fe transport
LGVKPDQDPSELNDVSLLPGAAIDFDVTEKSKLRVSASRTLARPQVRELAPFSFSDYFGGREVTGNPDLEMTKILNGDVRFEYFPSLREVLAASVFGKHFKDPIEPVLQPAGNSPVLRPENAEGAVLFGVELEARKNLGFMHGALHPFSLVSNLTLSHSRIDIDDESTVEGVTYLTNPSRPMANQSPVVFNAALDWEFENGTKGRLLYNVSARRLVEVGTQGLPDAYERARHMLDFTLGQRLNDHWQLKLSAENILNSPVIVTQGEDVEDDDSNVQVKYTTGRVFGITAEYEM